MKRHILLIEDEVNIARFVELELKHENFEVTVSNDGRVGYELAIDNIYDLLLIDVMLPNLNGLEICRRVRKVKDVPIILITARDAVIDRVSGLEAGADDYVVKPFAIEELLARIRAVLRRTGPNITSTSESVLSIRGLQVDQKAYKVTYSGQEIILTKTEYDLLVCFMQNQDIVLTRDQILEIVWGYQSEVETNVVDVYIRHLRKKLPNEVAILIETVRGVGYVIRS
ncbi:MAG: response regulator transcription factor [Psychrobacillus psychrodurans]